MMKKLLIWVACLVFGMSWAQTLTVYSGRNEAFIAPVVEMFEEQTGVDVEVRYGGTASLAASIFEEGRNSPADLFLAQDAGALGALASSELFQILPDSILNRVEARFRSPDDYWVGITGRARVVVYNTAIASTDLPSSVFELSQPEWQGRVGWAPTNGSFQAFVTAMRLVSGEEATRNWLEAMIANDVQVYPNNTSIVEATARGEVDVGLVNHYYLLRFIAEQGEAFPARNHFLQDADIGSMINVAGAGILKTSEAPELAEQFLAFLLSEVAQQHFTDTVYEYPLVADVATNSLLLPLEEINTPELDLSNLEDLEATLILLQDVGAF